MVAWCLTTNSSIHPKALHYTRVAFCPCIGRLRFMRLRALQTTSYVNLITSLFQTIILLAINEVLCQAIQLGRNWLRVQSYLRT
jgi:hypothetical protein